jgi:HipA-like protein
MKAKVFCKKRFAGSLEKSSEGYTFAYDETYISDPTAKSISLTLPKKQKKFHSDQLFPFFHGLLTEGFATKIQSRKLKIDEMDYLNRLLKTANYDTIGCVTLEEEN